MSKNQLLVWPGANPFNFLDVSFIICYPRGKNETALNERDERLEKCSFFCMASSLILKPLYVITGRREKDQPPDSALGKTFYLSLLAKLTALRPTGQISFTMSFHTGTHPSPQDT